MSTDFYATCAGERLVSASITIPYWGTWCADIGLALAADIPEQVTLIIGDLSLVGHVVRSAGYGGSRTARIVGGYGGWRKPVNARGYEGPTRSMILNDVAAEVGELIHITDGDASYPFFCREAGPAQRVLRQLAGQLWWVDPTGVTTIGPRPSGAIKSDLTVITYAGGLGRVSVATEHLADWMPGRSFTSPTVTTPQTISMTTLQVDNKGTLRLEVLGAS